MVVSPDAGTSVVIVSYYTGAALQDCVGSVLAQSGLSGLVLVDNGNPPDALAWLRSRAEADPRLRLITGHGNIGFAAGCNLGVAASAGELVLLLNPDRGIAARSIDTRPEAGEPP